MPSVAKHPGPGRPKDMEKHAAILSAAKQLFGERGYAGTSMDAVASMASVSKLTVYSHFGDKDTLFRAAVRARCTELFPDDLYLTDETTSVDKALLTIARHHAQLMTSQESVGIWRAISSDRSGHGPQLGRLLWEEGPQRVHALLDDFLASLARQGKLSVEDTGRAATQFMALLKGDLHLKRMVGCEEADCSRFEAEVQENAEAAVEMFLRAYRPVQS
ncbi:MAG: TetR/AcrR family transcriptional regulator [Rhodanobacteraceae bacterium]